MKENKTIAINAIIYELDDDTGKMKFSPLFHPPHSQVIGRQMVNILFINNHWLPITNLNRLLGEHQGNNVFCYRCLRNLYHPDRLVKHMERYGMVWDRSPSCLIQTKL